MVEAVKNHVDAKRYLRRGQRLSDGLSDASVHSLTLQGADECR